MFIGLYVTPHTHTHTMYCTNKTTHYDDPPDPLDIVPRKDARDSCAKALTLEPAILALLADSVVVSLAQFHLIIFLRPVVVHGYVPVQHHTNNVMYMPVSGVARCTRSCLYETNPTNNMDLSFKGLECS